MEDYTKDDVVNSLSLILKDSRQRALVDQRSYLMGILAYRFKMSEEAIATATGFKRTKVNYSKKLVLQFYKDKSYMKNVYVYAQMFPFDFIIIKKSSTVQRLKRVELDIDKKLFNKLKATGSILGHDDIRITIKFVLEKSMKVWEE